MLTEMQFTLDELHCLVDALAFYRKEVGADDRKVMGHTWNEVTALRGRLRLAATSALSQPIR